MLPVIAGAAALGAFGGAMKKGPDFQLSAYGQQAQGMSQQALSAYGNLVNAGPGAQDVTASLNATRGFANTLNNFASSGLNNMSMGNNLAAQQFAGQRTAMEQSFQDQLRQANQAAQLSGRSGNDPILRARLAQEQSRQSAQMNANQSSAALELGRQYSTDQIGLMGQSVGQLQGLSAQAFGNQQNLFGMAQQAYQGEYQMGMGQAQYKQSQGGGFMGALTGAMAGASAGLGAAQGLSAMSNQSAMTNAYVQNQGMQATAASANTAAAMNGGIGGLAAGSRGVANVVPTAQAWAPQASQMAPMPNFNFNQTLQASPFMSYQAPQAMLNGPFASVNPAQRSSVLGGNSMMWK